MIFLAPMALVVDAQWSEPKTNSTEDIEAAERRNQFEVIFHDTVFLLVYINSSLTLIQFYCGLLGILYMSLEIFVGTL